MPGWRYRLCRTRSLPLPPPSDPSPIPVLQVINFAKDVASLQHVLPRTASESNLILFLQKGRENTSRECWVKRARVAAYLQYFMKYHRFFREGIANPYSTCDEDQYIVPPVVPSPANLASLPENGVPPEFRQNGSMARYARDDNAPVLHVGSQLMLRWLCGNGAKASATRQHLLQIGLDPSVSGDADAILRYINLTGGLYDSSTECVRDSVTLTQLSAALAEVPLNIANDPDALHEELVAIVRCADMVSM